MPHAFRNKLGRVKSRKSNSSAAAVLGSKGGARGGPARAQRLPPEERSRIASAGGRARTRVRTVSYMPKKS